MSFESDAEFDARIDAEIDALLEERNRTMAEFTSDHRPLNMYAIYVRNLDMPPEKLAAQAGHAYLNAWDKTKELRPELAAQYKGTGNGTKICMSGKNTGQIRRAYKDLRRAGIPCDLIIDRGHVLPPHFTGKAIITAVGFGPVHADEVQHITKRYTMARPAVADIANQTVLD